MFRSPPDRCSARMIIPPNPPISPPEFPLRTITMLFSEQLSRPAVANQITTADRHLLMRRQEGRLSYTSGRGQPMVVVTYTISDDHLVIRVPAYNEIAWYAPGTEVT